MELYSNHFTFGKCTPKDWKKLCIDKYLKIIYTYRLRFELIIFTELRMWLLSEAIEIRIFIQIYMYI